MQLVNCSEVIFPLRIIGINPQVVIVTMGHINGYIECITAVGRFIKTGVQAINNVLLKVIRTLKMELDTHYTGRFKG